MDTTTLAYVGFGLVVAYLLFQRLANRKASPALVAEKLKAGALVVDVRSPGEFSSGAYPKARNIPVENLQSRLGDLPKDRPLVLYCASGARSARAAKMLKAAGFTDVVSAGGLADLPR